ncbi:MAG: hypothetical protein RLZZ546_2129 [Bacteroidota bacterium]|jgi:purine-nucleoside phosphorylase
MLKERLDKTCNFLRSIAIGSIDCAIILGTGLSKVEELVKEGVMIDYKDIPSFPVSTVDSHKGRLIYGKIHNKKVLMLSGRFHYYEGYDMHDVTYYIHVLKEMGVNQLIITNASGGLNPHLSNGDIVLVTDHINLFSQHPLRGFNDESFGPRFPDMLNAYPLNLRQKMKVAALKLNYKLKEGIYLGWQGPSLETPAEYKMARILGADILGMSSVPEVIVAKYRDIPIVMLSVVSNECFPKSKLKEATLEEIIHIMESSGDQMKKIINQFLQEE